MNLNSLKLIAKIFNIDVEKMGIIMQLVSSIESLMLRLLSDQNMKKTFDKDDPAIFEDEIKRNMKKLPLSKVDFLILGYICGGKSAADTFKKSLGIENLEELKEFLRKGTDDEMDFDTDDYEKDSEDEELINKLMNELNSKPKSN